MMVVHSPRLGRKSPLSAEQMARSQAHAHHNLVRGPPAWLYIHSVNLSEIRADHLAPIQSRIPRKFVSRNLIMVVSARSGRSREDRVH